VPRLRAIVTERSSSGLRSHPRTLPPGIREARPGTGRRCGRGSPRRAGDRTTADEGRVALVWWGLRNGRSPAAPHPSAPGEWMGRCLDRFFEGEGRQDAGQTRATWSSGSGGPDEDEVVPARGRDLEGTAGHDLPRTSAMSAGRPQECAGRATERRWAQGRAATATAFRKRDAGWTSRPSTMAALRVGRGHIARAGRCSAHRIWAARGDRALASPSRASFAHQRTSESARGRTAIGVPAGRPRVATVIGRSHLAQRWPGAMLTVMRRSHLNS